MTAEVEVEELGISGRLVPTDAQVDAIVQLLRDKARADLLAAMARTRPPAKGSLWRFSARSWGSHPADGRARPQRSKGA